MFYDRVELKNTPKFTADGYMVAVAKVARTGIQLYSGDEMGKPELDVVRVYRPESEVFDTGSLHSFAYRPMTNDHPAEAVTSKSWHDVAIGQAGGEVLRDGDHIRVPLIMMDATAIDAFKAGKRELSVGYTADVKWESGKTPDGEEYDAIQHNIRANHIALVQAGRAGTARIGDTGGHQNSPSQPEGGHKMADRKVKFGDVTIEVSEQAAEAIAALTEQLKAAQAEAEAAGADAKQKQEEADKALAAKDAEIDKLKAEALTGDKLDAAIADRVKLISDAKKIVDLDYKGDADAIRKQAVVAIVGDSVKDKSAAYIEARFDALLESAGKAGSTNDHEVADFQAAYEAKLTSAWSK